MRHEILKLCQVAADFEIGREWASQSLRAAATELQGIPSPAAIATCQTVVMGVATFLDALSIGAESQELRAMALAIKIQNMPGEARLYRSFVAAVLLECRRADDDGFMGSIKQMADDLKVSTQIIRDACIVLQTYELVEMHSKSGTQITDLGRAVLKCMEGLKTDLTKRGSTSSSADAPHECSS